MTPFTYLIGWTKHNLYYYGARYAKDADVSQLMTTYMTSSKKVKAFIELNGMPDIVEVRRTFTSVDACRLWEERVLKRMKVRTSEKWLNQTDRQGLPPRYGCDSWNGLKMSGEGKSNISKALTGKKHTEEHKLNNSKAQTGKVISEKARESLSKALKGRVMSEDHKSAIGESLKGRVITDEWRKKLSDAAKKRELKRREDTQPFPSSLD